MSGAACRAVWRKSITSKPKHKFEDPESGKCFLYLQMDKRVNATRDGYTRKEVVAVETQEASEVQILGESHSHVRTLDTIASNIGSY